MNDQDLLKLAVRIFIQAVGLAVIYFSLGFVLFSTGVASANGCLNEDVRTGPGLSSQLSDCRAYELVSPAIKNGWPVEGLRTNGSRAIMTSFGAFGGNDQPGTEHLYTSDRLNGPYGGWATFPFIEPEGHIIHSFEPAFAVSNDLNIGLFEYNLTRASITHEEKLYISPLPTAESTQSNGTPAEEVGPVFSSEALAKNPANTVPSATSIPSASDQLTTIVFAIQGPALSEPGIDYLWRSLGDTTVDNAGSAKGNLGFMSLYEYKGTDNREPTLVGVNNQNKLIGQCGVSLGFPTEGKFDRIAAEDVYNVISSDGSRVFFTVSGATQGLSGDSCTIENTGTGPPADELFARVLNRIMGKNETIAISQPSQQDCSACNVTEPADAVFQGASKDGSKVFFLSEQKLLPGARGKNLYEYNFDAEMEGRPKGKRVTLVASRVSGVVRVAPDGLHVYFVSEEVLPGGSNPVGDMPKSEADNLYVYGEEHFAFVGTLSPADSTDWRQIDLRPVDTTPDGQFLVFDSAADLKHEDTRGVTQVFAYEARSGEFEPALIRVSTGGSGHVLFGSEILEKDFEGHQNPAPQLGTISNDGSRVVFQSRDALVPGAAAGYINVYQYHAGQVSLISDGEDRTNDTALLGIDGSGQDIFFVSGDQLVPQDGDTQMDVYDARINGGFPAPAAPVRCEGEGCQGPLSPGSVFPATSSTGQTPEDEAGGLSSTRPVVRVKPKPKKKDKKKLHIRHHVKTNTTKKNRHSGVGRSRGKRLLR